MRCMRNHGRRPICHIASHRHKVFFIYLHALLKFGKYWTGKIEIEVYSCTVLFLLVINQVRQILDSTATVHIHLLMEKLMCAMMIVIH